MPTTSLPPHTAKTGRAPSTVNPRTDLAVKISGLASTLETGLDSIKRAQNAPNWAKEAHRASKRLVVELGELAREVTVLARDGVHTDYESLSRKISNHMRRATQCLTFINAPTDAEWAAVGASKSCKTFDDLKNIFENEYIPVVKQVVRDEFRCAVVEKLQPIEADVVGGLKAARKVFDDSASQSLQRINDKIVVLAGIAKQTPYSRRCRVDMNMSPSKVETSFVSLGKEAVRLAAIARSDKSSNKSEITELLRAIREEVKVCKSDIADSRLVGQGLGAFNRQIQQLEALATRNMSESVATRAIAAKSVSLESMLKDFAALIDKARTRPSAGNLEELNIARILGSVQDAVSATNTKVRIWEKLTASSVSGMHLCAAGIGPISLTAPAGAGYHVTPMGLETNDGKVAVHVQETYDGYFITISNKRTKLERAYEQQLMAQHNKGHKRFDDHLKPMFITRWGRDLKNYIGAHMRAKVLPGSLPPEESRIVLHVLGNKVDKNAVTQSVQAFVAHAAAGEKERKELFGKRLNSFEFGSPQFVKLIGLGEGASIGAAGETRPAVVATRIEHCDLSGVAIPFSMLPVPRKVVGEQGKTPEAAKDGVDKESAKTPQPSIIREYEVDDPSGGAIQSVGVIALKQRGGLAVVFSQRIDASVNAAGQVDIPIDMQDSIIQYLSPKGSSGGMHRPKFSRRRSAGEWMLQPLET